MANADMAATVLARGFYASDVTGNAVYAWAIFGGSIAMLSGWIAVAISSLRRRTVVNVD